MIEWAQGDIFASGCEALVNPVNARGVMGKGLALAFKRAFPANFAAYREACQAGRLAAGGAFAFERDVAAGGPRLIVNVATKGHWRSKSRLEDVDAGLAELAGILAERGVASVAVPPLGCGLGALPWEEVRALIVARLAPLPGVTVRVYEPR